LNKLTFLLSADIYCKVLTSESRDYSKYKHTTRTDKVRSKYHRWKILENCKWPCLRDQVGFRIICTNVEYLLQNHQLKCFFVKGLDWIWPSCDEVVLCASPLHDHKGHYVNNINSQLISVYLKRWIWRKRDMKYEIFVPAKNRNWVKMWALRDHVFRAI
jgi:hypothetical protein